MPLIAQSNSLLRLGVLLWKGFAEINIKKWGSRWEGLRACSRAAYQAIAGKGAGPFFA